MDDKTKPALLRFMELPSNNRSLFVRAAWILPFMACATRVVGFQRLQRWIEGRNGRREKKDDRTRTSPSTVARMVLVAARYGIARGNCLSRSLSLCYLLRHEGYDPHLRLGGRQEGISFEAHAWVELDGMAVDDQDDGCASFVPFSVHLNNEFTTQK